MPIRKNSPKSSLTVNKDKRLVQKISRTPILFARAGLHTIQTGKPSLVCDFQELYRYLIDNHLIERCRNLHKKDFVLATDCMIRPKMGKRIHICEYETNGLAEGLDRLFENKVEIPRMGHGSRQSLDTLINEEAYLLAQYLRNEKPSWIPRLVTI